MTMADEPAPPPYRPTSAWDLPEEPSPIQQPLRLAVASGALVVVAGVFLPWLDYGVDTFHDSANGLTGDTWGIIVMVAAVALVLTLGSRLLARSRSRPAQLLPAALGLAQLVSTTTLSWGRRSWPRLCGCPATTSRTRRACRSCSPVCLRAQPAAWS